MEQKKEELTKQSGTYPKSADTNVIPKGTLT